MPVKVGDRVSVYISQPVPLNIDQNLRKCITFLNIVVLLEVKQIIFLCAILSSQNYTGIMKKKHV